MGPGCKVPERYLETLQHTALFTLSASFKRQRHLTVTLQTHPLVTHPVSFMVTLTAKSDNRLIEEVPDPTPPKI